MAQLKKKGGADAAHNNDIFCHFHYIAKLLIMASSSLFADEPAKIRDNSFLIEEAYNQEYGVFVYLSLEHPLWKKHAE